MDVQLVDPRLVILYLRPVTKFPAGMVSLLGRPPPASIKPPPNGTVLALSMLCLPKANLPRMSGNTKVKPDCPLNGDPYVVPMML